MPGPASIIWRWYKGANQRPRARDGQEDWFLIKTCVNIINNTDFWIEVDAEAKAGKVIQKSDDRIEPQQKSATWTVGSDDAEVMPRMKLDLQVGTREVLESRDAWQFQLVAGSEGLYDSDETWIAEEDKFDEVQYRMSIDYYDNSEFEEEDAYEKENGISLRDAISKHTEKYRYDDPADGLERSPSPHGRKYPKEDPWYSQQHGPADQKVLATDPSGQWACIAKKPEHQMINIVIDRA